MRSSSFQPSNDVLDLRNFEGLKMGNFAFLIFETKKPSNPKNKKQRNQGTKQLFYFPSRVTPPTPPKTDSHPNTSPPLGGHEGTWGKRVANPFLYSASALFKRTIFKDSGFRWLQKLTIELVVPHLQGTSGRTQSEPHVRSTINREQFYTATRHTSWPLCS